MKLDSVVPDSAASKASKKAIETHENAPGEIGSQIAVDVAPQETSSPAADEEATAADESSTVGHSTELDAQQGRCTQSEGLLDGDAATLHETEMQQHCVSQAASLQAKRLLQGGNHATSGPAPVSVIGDRGRRLLWPQLLRPTQARSHLVAIPWPPSQMPEYR